MCGFKMKTSKMKLGNLTSTILILTSFFCVQSAPAKPLNERSTELTWQAWLLVDDQNQNKQYDPEGLIRRRITPKSVFIAPTFRPEDLPSCADGYTSDQMGRCIKVIKIDQEQHWNFLLENHLKKFESYDEYDDEEEEENLPTPGPFQVNIPLDGKKSGGSEEDTNVAIVVAPTNGSFNLSSNDTVILKRGGNNTSHVDAPLIITKINIQPEEMETTTMEIETTTLEVPTTTIEDETVPTTTEIETTTMEIETTTGVPQAIFFKIPEKNETEANPEKVNDFVRFPDEEVKEPTKTFSPQVYDSTEQIVRQIMPHAKVKTKFDANEKLLEDYIRDTQMDDRIFKNRDTSERSTQRVYNHRNRDKWLFPPAWRDNPPQKPLILRLNNVSGSSHLPQHRPEAVYREVSPEFLSYIFGSKRSNSHS